MRRVAAGVVLAALLMLFVARITRTSEKRVEGQETTTALTVAVECPCGGVCALHAQMACDYEAPLAEAESNVLKLPRMHAVSQRGYIKWHSSTVTNSGLRTGYVINTELRAGRVLKLPCDGRRLNIKESTTTIHGTSEALTQKGHFSVGVL